MFFARKIQGNQMKPRLYLLLILLATVLAFFAHSRGIFSSASTQATAPQAPTAPRTPVLVELFTSEGCSSCPPADALVARLVQSQPVPGAEIIVLKEHVDYWNRSDWRDRFSSPQFTSRQHRYADFFGADTVYTPQMVVDGAVEFVGSNERRALAAVSSAAKSPKPALQLQLIPSTTSDDAALRISLPSSPTGSPGDTAELFLALTEGGITSEIRGGENVGRTILHEAVVRRLESVTTFAKNSPALSRDVPLKLDPAWNRQRLRAVAFLQERTSRRILAVSSLSLAP